VAAEVIVSYRLVELRDRLEEGFLGRGEAGAVDAIVFMLQECPDG